MDDAIRRVIEEASESIRNLDWFEVKELQEASGMSQTLVSHHLAPLREHELVSVEPRGRSNIYTLCCEQLGDPATWLATLAATTPEGAEACCPTGGGGA